MGHNDWLSSAEKLIGNIFPGDAIVIKALRQKLSDIVSSPGLTTVLIEGNPGTGKTTTARALAMAWMLARVPIERHNYTLFRAIQAVRRGHALKWYRDISLAGLNEGLAEAQLFGVGSKVATGVGARLGIFEQAMTGARPDASDPHKKLVSDAHKNDPIPLVTAGAVLLDEIGDLPIGLQPKLLRVLNAERQYRLGVEGDDRFSFEFHGLAMLATWRDVDGLETLRDDLKQRICQHRIRLPGVSEYPPESKKQIIESVWVAINDEIKQERERLEKVLDEDKEDSKTDAVLSDWMSRLLTWSTTALSEDVLAKLVDIDWSKRGNLRGLREVVRRLLMGVSLEEARERTKGMEATNDHPVLPKEGVDVIKDAVEKELTLSDWWKSRRNKWANDMLTLLRDGDSKIQTIADQRAGGVPKLKKDLENLTRSKSR